MPSVPNPGIRGRSTYRSFSQMSDQEIPNDNSASGGSNAARNGRPRAHLPMPATLPSVDVGNDATLNKKSKSFSFTRVFPSSAIVAIITLTFLVFAAFVARNLNSVVIPERPATVVQPPSVLIEPDSGIPANIDTEDDMTRFDPGLSNPDGLTDSKNQPITSTFTSGDNVSVNGVPKSLDESSSAADDAVDAASGRVSWTRSWPLTQDDDVTGLYNIATELRFTNSTMLDYFHMHKTGGVTTKTQIRELLNIPENKRLLTKRGKPLGMIETCYQAVSPLTNLSVLETTWRCDFRQIKELPADDLIGIDIVLGHQYWNKGCDFYFGALRDVRYFSIFRHPLHRKLSFYYHFFARNMGRDEKDVPRDEIIDFVLARDLPNDPRMRDAGPNYFASRMLSDGMSGFKLNQYPVPREEQDAILDDILSRLENRFVFTGLQLQTEANQCMMTKTVQLLAHVHGVDTLVGTPKLAESQKRLNSGEYSWTGQRLWESMSEEQKAEFREVERMDLAIYNKAVEKFKKSVKLFGCEHKVVEENWQEDDFQ